MTAHTAHILCEGVIPQRVQHEDVQVVLLDLLAELSQKRLTGFNSGR